MYFNLQFNQNNKICDNKTNLPFVLSQLMLIKFSFHSQQGISCWLFLKGLPKKNPTPKKKETWNKSVSNYTF